MTRLGLRARATLAGTAFFALVLTLGAVLLVQTLDSRLTHASDGLARSRVAELRDLARDDDLPRTIRTIDDNSVAQVVDDDGTVLAASPNVAGRPAVARLAATARLQTRTFDAPDDQEIETYRFWYAAGPSPHGRVTVYVGSSLESASEASAALRHALWLGVPLVVVALGVVIWLLLGRALGRLDRIRAEVDRISEDTLDARVAGDGVDDEVGRLAATMNALLARLDAAARRQRDLVADVSHDLQSPLAAQRVALELAAARPDRADVTTLASEVLLATDDMERMVHDLLALASLDQGVAATPRPVDLDELVLEEATRARTPSRARIDTSAVTGAPAYADPDDVRRIVRNLLDNALAHTGTEVRLATSTACDEAVLDIVDDGPGIAADQRDLVFDRFHRADPARAHRAGSGLGLPIARGLAERNGGSVEIVDSAAGAHLRVRLPGWR